MDAYVAIPASGSGPGVLVLMEIFGVGTYIRGATDRLAEHGYVALAPDLYRRTRPGVQFGKGPEGLQEAFAAVSELDMAGAIEDAIVALGTLRALPEVTGGAGVLGFCLGGTLAFGVAVGADPDTLVAYYGSGIPEMLGDADAIRSPALFHFGAQDPYIPLEQSQRVADAAVSHPRLGGRDPARRGSRVRQLGQPDVPPARAGRAGVGADPGLPGANAAHRLSGRRAPR